MTAGSTNKVTVIVMEDSPQPPPEPAKSRGSCLGRVFSLLVVIGAAWFILPKLGISLPGSNSTTTPTPSLLLTAPATQVITEKRKPTPTVAASAVSGSRTALASPTPRVSGVTFPETGKTVAGQFLDYWNASGGVRRHGYPISQQIEEVSDLDGKRYTVQYFERSLLEMHPENSASLAVLPAQLGTLRYKAKYSNGAPGQTPNTGGRFFPETSHYVGGRFLDFWEDSGGILAIGYPISDAFVEVSDVNGKSYTVQYFERALFELHPENRAPDDVQLAQLGTLRYNQLYVKK